MRHCISAIFIIIISGILSYAQDGRSRINGIIIEAGSQEPVIQAFVEFLSTKDSTRIDATVSDLDGKFSISAAPGNYILKFSMLGFEDQTRNIIISQRNQEYFIGTIRLEQEPMVLEGARTFAKIPSITIIEDTVVYNAAAYHVDDDADITELLKKIPGLEINNNTATLQGKAIKKIMINGKEAFGENIIEGLKNIPAEMIDKILAYERETDESRISGVDDGEDIAVLDLTVKKKFMDGWRSNASGGYGTSGRFSGRYSANKLTDEAQISTIANIGNENARLSSSDNNRIGSGGTGEATSGSAGMTFSNKKGNKEKNGNIRFAHSSSDIVGQRYSEGLLKSSTSFSSNEIYEDSKKDELNANYTLQFKPSGKTTILFKPTINYLGSNAFSTSVGTTYSDKEQSTAINGINHRSDKDSYNLKINLSAQLTHRLNNQGRSISGNIMSMWNQNATNQYKNYDTYYYKSSKDVLKETDNQIGTLSSYTVAWFSMNEPLNKRWSLQSTIHLYYKHEHRERYAIDIIDQNLNEHEISEYNYFGIKCLEGLRYNSKKIFSILGVTVLQQWGVLPYNGDKIRTHVFNASPTLRFNYTKNKNEKIKILYSCSPSIPTLYNLTPYSNYTDPLNIRSGNPYLKPPFRQDATISYNLSDIVKQTSLICNAQYTSTRNAVSNSTIYDENTGGRTITPRNINGNWKASGSAVWDKTFKDSRYSMSSHSWAEYQNNMSYLYDKSAKVDEINQTMRIMLREKVEVCRRSGWLEILLSGTIELTDERSALRPSLNQKPYFYSMKFNPALTMPWKMRLSSSFEVLCQRGYDYTDLNKDYLLWNATVSQTFFKGRITARLSAYDILNQQCNMVRSYNMERRTTTTYNGIHKYVILRLTWRF